jgi:hypothetical protein
MDVNWKFLTGLFFIISIILAATSLHLYSESIRPEDVKVLLDKINSLEEKNMMLAEELRRTNMSLQQYMKQTALYRERLQELESERNVSAQNITASASLDAPAVTQKVEYVGRFPFLEKRVVYEGAMMEISVEIRPGAGRVLVVTKPLMGVIFQDAARTAVYVAQAYTGRDLSGSDVIFSVKAEEEIPAVDGPSAGGLMTVLTILALEGKSPSREVTMTGTIDKDGYIGEVGGIVEKATAAKKAGKKLLLLSEDNSYLVQYREVRRNYFGFIIIERSPELVDAKSYIEDEIGIKVEYVRTIDDALKYFLG